MMPDFGLSTLGRALVVWLLFLVAETAQGALRRVLTGPDVEFAIRQASVVIGAVVLFFITWVCLRWMRLRTSRAALSVGLVWVAATLAFELGLGRLMGLSWDRLLEDYDLVHGGLMPVGLAAMALTPWAVKRLQANRMRR